MASTDLPQPAPDLELPRAMGAWYLLASNRASFRSRTHPRVDHELLGPEPDGRARVRTTLRFRSPDLLGRAKRRAVAATAVAEPGGEIGRFCLRGQGLASIGSSRFCFALIDPDYRWAAIWHTRSGLGSPGGLDLCFRDPSIPQVQLDAVLEAVRSHPFLAAAGRDGRTPRWAGLVATTQDWIPPAPYRLE